MPADEFAKPIRFIFLSLGYYPEQTGGAYRYVAEVANRLVERGHMVDVIHPSAQGASIPEQQIRGVRVHRIQNETGFFVSNWLKENRAARKTVDQLIKNGTHLTVVCLVHAFFWPAAKDYAKQMIYLFTGPWAEEYRFSRMARLRSAFTKLQDRLIAFGLHQTEDRALHSAAHIATISDYYCRLLPQWHGKNLPSFTMISGGVDTEHFKPCDTREAVRTRFDVTNDSFLFLTVRRLDPRMGLLLLLKSFSRIISQFPNVRLWMAGGGPQEEELRAEIDRRKLGQHVRLLGFVSDTDLPGVYTAADCSITPSLDLEGFGLSTVESLACGTPVLGSRAGATPELLQSLSEKLLFEPDSIDSLVSKLTEILTNPAVLPDRDRCRRHVMEHFTWDRTVTQFEQCAREAAATVSRA